ncbi:MAG TPA: hypothetical protein VJM08_04845 [Anaerolineales bacterium]|nr:hypothetical protein [Anaerolineales bacterium]
MVTIEKSKNSKDRKVRVMFTMPAMEDCDCLYLVGRFYNWNESIYRMQRRDNGTWELTLELEFGRQFQYCFRTNNGEWLKDPSVPDARHVFGSEISLESTLAGTFLN